MTKTHAGNFFEDFVVDSEIHHPVPRTVSEGDQAVYVALTGDRSVLPSSAELARRVGFEREPVHELLVFHIVFGRTVNDISLNAVANLGYAGLRFLRPVYPGDTLRAVSKVIGKRENSSGKTGIVWVRTTGTNQDGAIVIEFFRWVMVHKRDPATPTGAADKPEMPPEVESDQLVVPEFLHPAGLSEWATGSTAKLNDYEVGERIDHIDGMTIEEAEHAMATRLYQNTAKVHFDAYAMKDSRFGKRLIYGGHVISVCRALAFNGLQSSLGILAFNAGTHANPTFAGDTLYAYSEVLDKQPVLSRDDCGALRLRTIGMKNHDPLKDPVPPKQNKDGKEVYHPNVVLDLDWWLLLPR